MTYEATTTVSAAEVILRAKTFFAERVPQSAAFPEHEGPSYLLLRGQGGEEIAIAMQTRDGLTHVRGSTLLFDQGVDRFLSTLPCAPGAAR